MNSKKSKTSIKISVFSIAFALGLNIAGVSPVLGLLSEAFKDQGSNAIQSLQTIPYFLLMVASIFVGWLVTKISKKKLVLGGLLLIAFIGSSPFIVNSFSFIMVSRVLVGFGFGIISPLNTAFISEFFEGKDRAGMMGLHVAGMGIGAMCINIVGGIVGKLGYQQYFLIHLISLVTFILVLFLLPDTGAEVPSKSQKLKLNRKVYELSFTSFFHTLFITAYSTNIGIHIAANLNGDSAVTGIVTAINAGFALLIGIFFSRISLLFKQFTLPFSILMAGLGFLSITLMPNSMAGILLASACCGISLSCFMAQASYVISTSVSQVAIALAGGVFALIGGIGGLISPIVLNTISKLVLGSESTNAVFLMCTIGMFVLTIYSFALVKIREKEAIEKIEMMEKKVS